MCFDLEMEHCSIKYVLKSNSSFIKKSLNFGNPVIEQVCTFRLFFMEEEFDFETYYLEVVCVNFLKLCVEND